MTFCSILFESSQDRKEENIDMPDFFVDLNLDQIVENICCDKKEYNLKPFYHVPLDRMEAINYRQEIMMDLGNQDLLEKIKIFAQRMRKMRELITFSEKLYYKYNKEGWFLEIIGNYCETIKNLVHDLSSQELRSRGLLAFRDYITNYEQSIGFSSLFLETKKMQSELSAIKYCLLIKGNCIKVSKYENEIDYTQSVEQTFQKFRQGEVKDYRAKLPVSSDMNHVEAGVLDLVAQLHPEVFSRLDDYCFRNQGYLDETVNIFDREIQFYIAYLDFLQKLKQAGLRFCFPKISKSKDVYNREGFDLALAYKLINEGSSVVCNDFYLEGKERIFVISGPNQGGKTTFARTFGQLHFLASLGCPVPGREARLFQFDRIFSHFEREENIKDLRGKLQDDLIRIHYIMKQASANSIIIINEIFTSTTLHDAILLGKRILQEISDSDCLCVCVTFIDELSSLTEKTVSMVSTIVPQNPALRTFKIIRKQADGVSYAVSIAEKYGLTYICLKERLKL